jgi:protein-disulfide isomerase
MQVCIAGDTFKDKIQKDTESGDRAMANIPSDSRGTPYQVLVNVATGVKVSIAGAYPYDAFKQAIDGLLANTTKTSNINLDPITATDHYFGNKNAQVVIVEYGDMECPYCAEVHPTIQKIITDYNGKVAWVYRDFPLTIHANAQVKAEAAECSSQQGGDATFFKYVDKLYADIREEIHPTFDTTTL